MQYGFPCHGSHKDNVYSDSVAAKQLDLPRLVKDAVAFLNPKRGLISPNKHVNDPRSTHEIN